MLFEIEISKHMGPSVCFVCMHIFSELGMGDPTLLQMSSSKQTASGRFSI